jgi:curved DNA-binding protein CbpA
MQTHYEILGVRENASKREIRAAYLRLIEKYHPDRNPRPDANRIAAQLNVAYEVLSDDASRAAYDRELQARRPPPPVTVAAAPRSAIAVPRAWGTLLGLVLLAAAVGVGIVLLMPFRSRIEHALRLPQSVEAPQSKMPAEDGRRGGGSRVRTSRPESGTPLQTPLDMEGRGLLAIENLTQDDAVVYLFENGSHRIARSFYLRAGEAFIEREITPGTYRVTCVTGREWDAATERFTRNVRLNRVLGTVEFSQTHDDEGQPDRYQLRLLPADVESQWREGQQ